MMETFQCLISICGIEFTNKKDLSIHYDEAPQEKEVNEAKANYVRKLVPDELIKIIVPDKEFLTRNTKDLEDMLKALPKETFYTEDIEFQKDFKDILNEKVDDCNTNDKFTCDQCKFKASSARCLNAHKRLVHDATFYVCKQCQRRTKTVSAMKEHMWRVHKQIVVYNDPGKPKDTVNMMTPPEPSSTDSSENETNSSESDFDETPELYQEKKWKDGYNYKSRAPTFVKAVTNLRSLLRKNAKEKNVFNVKIRVTDVEHKVGEKLAKIEVIDEEGTGEVQMHTWVPSKKNNCAFWFSSVEQVRQPARPV